MSDKVVPIKDDKLKRLTLQDLLARFAYVTIGGRVRVMELVEPGGDIKFLWEESDFKAYYKERVTLVGADGKAIKKKLYEVWFDHEKFRRYERIVYDMPGSFERARVDDYNAWRGFIVKPEAGEWTKNKDHIRDVICNGNEAYFKWLMNWLASLFQKPGRHAWTAVVLMGGQGIGKGYFADYMIGRSFFGQQYTQINGASQLTERFNEILSGKVVIFADESTWGGDHRAIGRLKALVTEDRVTIERKFLAPVAEPSMLHIFIASNNDWPIPIDRDDRRFFVLTVSEERRQDEEYFKALREEFDNGGRAAMIAELKAWQVDEKALRHPPGTEAKGSLTHRNLRFVERWWLEVLEQGYLKTTLADQRASDFDDEVISWPLDIKKTELHEQYVAFLERHAGNSREPRITETELGTFLTRELGLDWRVRELRAKRHRVWTLPKLSICRMSWTTRYGLGLDKEWGSPDEEGNYRLDGLPPGGEREPGDDDDLP